MSFIRGPVVGEPRFPTMNTVANTAANAVKTTGLTVGAIVAGSLFVAYKTAKACIKIPIVAGINTYKLIKHSRKCCGSMLDAVKHNHIECFDVWFAENNMHTVIEAFKFVEHVVRMTQTGEPITQELQVYMIMYNEFQNDLQADLDRDREYYTNKCTDKKSHRDSDLIFTPTIKTINMYLEDRRQRSQEKIINKLAYKKYTELIRMDNEHVSLIRSQKDVYNFNNCMTFCGGFLSLFSSVEMCRHLFETKRIPEIMLRKVLVEQAYQYYYLLSQSHELSEAEKLNFGQICELLPAKHKYNPMVVERSFNPSTGVKLVRKFLNVSKYFNIQDQHYMFEDFTKNKPKLTLYSKPQDLHGGRASWTASEPLKVFSKEELDQYMEDYYKHNHPVDMRHFFVFCLEHLNSIYLRSYLKHYGEIQDESCTVFSMESQKMMHVLELFHKSIFTKHRSDTQHFIMQEFLRYTGRYKYIREQTSRNVLCFFFDIDKHKMPSSKHYGVFENKTKRVYSAAREKLVRGLLDTTRITKDVCEIVCDYSI